MDVELFKDKLQELKESIKLVDIIKASTSNNSDPHRKLADEIGIKFLNLQSIYKAQELKLLIDYYTFCEQLMKQFIYSVLAHTTDTNLHRKKYLNNNLNPRTFSPRVKYKEIEENLDKYLDSEKKIKLLSFCIEYDIKDHDELISARHDYAHSGKKPPFSILDYMRSSIVFLEFLLNDFQNIEAHLSTRLKLQETVLELREEHKNLKKLNVQNKEWKKRCGNLKEKASDAYRLLAQLEIDSEVYISLKLWLQKFQKIDLRRSSINNQNFIKTISLNS